MTQPNFGNARYSTENDAIYRNLLNYLEEDLSLDFDSVPKKPFLKSLLTSTKLFPGSTHHSDINLDQFLVSQVPPANLPTDSSNLLDFDSFQFNDETPPQSKPPITKSSKFVPANQRLRPTFSYEAEYTIHWGLESLLLQLFTKTRIDIPSGLNILDFKILSYVISKTSGQRVLIRSFKEQKNTLKSQLSNNQKIKKTGWEIKGTIQKVRLQNVSLYLKTQD